METFLTNYRHKHEFKAAMKSAERMSVWFEGNQPGTLRELMARGLTEWVVVHPLGKWRAIVTIKRDGYRGLKAVVE